MILNGFATADDVADATAKAHAVGAATWTTPEPVQDLEAYRQAIAVRPAHAYCCVNSYARPLADAWLAKLVGAAGDDGLAAATGSYETQRVPFPAAAPAGPRRQLEHVGPAVRTRLAFPAFPNPHLRTNALAFTDLTARRLAWPRVRDKAGALRVESGRRSLSRQAARTVLVDVDGDPVPSRDWPHARIFRSGDQERLLVADNRTDQYARATEDERAALRALAWGRQA